jgi:hypothetical protein
MTIGGLPKALRSDIHKVIHKVRVRIAAAGEHVKLRAVHETAAARAVATG